MKSLSSVASPLAALFLLSPSVLADQRHITNYQPGFTEEAACYRYEYKEEYVPGNSQSKGYVKSHRDKIEVQLDETKLQEARTLAREYWLNYGKENNTNQ